LDWVDERDTLEFVPLSLEPGLSGGLFEATAPGSMGRAKHALKSMTRYPNPFAMTSKQVLEPLGRVVDTIMGVVLYFFDRPVPNPS